MGVKGGGKGRDRARRCGPKRLGKKETKEEGSQEEKIEDEEGKRELKMRRQKQGPSPKEGKKE